MEGKGKYTSYELILESNQETSLATSEQFGCC